MSDDSDSSSGSENEDLETTGLIATRQKRVTAGNLYATLRANLDDEELQKELLAEDEEGDAGDYEGDEEEDDVLESSSEDEDAGPPQEGEAEELEGEKDLKKQERAEAKQKRRAHDARLKIPAWQQKKKVKLADDAKASDGGSTSERPRKKSERSNWLPTGADAPVRQSGRALAVANREVVHAHLKHSAERSEKQRRVMKDAAEREKGRKGREDISQADRMRKCEKIERETARDFGRWEREEAERQRLRDEALAAKRQRGLDGPFVRYWSGSVVWEGDKIKMRRVSHGSREVEELLEEKAKADAASVLDAYKSGELGEEEGDDTENVMSSHEGARKEEPRGAVQDHSSIETKVAQSTQNAPATSSAVQDTPDDPPALQGATEVTPNTDVTTTSMQTPAPIAAPITSGENPPGQNLPWLEGIQDYAAQPVVNPAIINNYIPSAPSINGSPSSQQPATYPLPTYPSQPVEIYHGWPPGVHDFPLPTEPPPAAPLSVPLLREQAQRSLLILTSFPSLSSNPTTEKTKRSKAPPVLNETTTTNPIKSILLPSSYPPLTPQEARYLTTRPRKRTNLNEVPLPPAPIARKCALTCWKAKYVDPKTGIAYADMHQYKALQRLIAGGAAWSGFLGCWIGPKTGKNGLGGRAAKGVPDGFD